jgi:alpha-tubulin suppressor-like RCC1 family protein
MNKLVDKYITNLLILNQYFVSIYSNHYPKEIVLLIIQIYYDLFPIKLACGPAHNLLLFDDQLWVWGSNDEGQLGYLSSHNDVGFPTQSHDLFSTKITKLNGGEGRSMFLLKDGRICAWGVGWENYFCLGHKIDWTSHLNLKKISSMEDHSMAVDDKDELYVCGDNNYAQLGLGHTWPVQSSRKNYLKNVKKICCGGSHSMAMTVSNKIYVWGSNKYGQLGLGHREETTLPCELKLSNVSQIACGYNYSMALTNTGEVWVWGITANAEYSRTMNSPQQMILPPIKKIASGYNHVVAVTYSGELYIWGDHRDGRLGLGHNQKITSPQKLNLPPIKKVKCGEYHTIAITIFNEIYVWGGNYNSQLGTGDYTNYNAPQKISLNL